MRLYVCEVVLVLIAKGGTIMVVTKGSEMIIRLCSGCQKVAR